MTKTSTTLLLLVAALAGTITSASGPETLSPSSEITFRNENYEYEYKSSAIRAEDLWVVVGVRARGQMDGAEEYQIWKIDPQGKKLSQINLTSIKPVGHPQDRYLQVYDLVTLKNGNIALLADARSELDFLVFDGGTGKMVTNHAVAATVASSFITKTLVASDGDLVLIGRAGTKGILLKLHPSGETAAQILIEDKDLTVLTDALELADHTFMLLGERLSGTGEIMTWIGKMAQNGDVIFKNTFVGKDGTIDCSSRDHNCAVVYSSAGTDGWNIAVRTFTGTLSPSWQADLLSGIRVYPRFRVAMVSEESVFVVGGNAKNRLWMAVVSKNEQVTASFTFEEHSAKWQRLWNYDLLATSQDFIVPFTELIVGDELEQRQVLKILRVRRPQARTMSAFKP